MSNKTSSVTKPLRNLAFVMLVVFLFSVIGIFIDHRIVTGAPVWLKPAKFAISIAIYSYTLAWICTYLTPVPRYLKMFTWITVISFVIEIVIIDLQAARGTTSHFNRVTALDSV